MTKSELVFYDFIVIRWEKGMEKRNINEFELRVIRTLLSLYLCTEGGKRSILRVS